MPAQPKVPSHGGCARRSKIKALGAGGRKSRRVFPELGNVESLVKLGAVSRDESVTAEAETEAVRALGSTGSVSLDLKDDLMSSNATEPEKPTQESLSLETDNKVSAADDKQVLLIEGNKAFFVVSNPWPKRTRVSVREDYKKPNPRLTPRELVKQRRLVDERRALVDETRRQKLRSLYKDGVFLLPKRLLIDSKSRLLYWYKLTPDEA